MPIDSHLNYLQKHAFCPPQIASIPHEHLGIVVVIPCHDEPDLLLTLRSLQACMPSACAVEVIVVISSSATDDMPLKLRNQTTFDSLQDWAHNQHDARLQFHFLHFPELPPKHAGVGLTRKIGMDEAVYRFAWADSPKGIIVSLDADTLCDIHYLQAIERYFDTHRKVDSCSIAFEFVAEDADPLIAEAILRIELAERMLVAGLRKCGHPYAFLTLGAAMAVRTGAYQVQAGMNKRKTGEDFDFLQKFIELGVHGDCTEAMVYPSARISRRKPNGIGQRVAQYCAAPEPDFPVFAFDSFLALAQGLKGVPSWYTMDQATLEADLERFPEDFKRFMQENEFLKTISEIQHYTNSAAAFEKRFFRWFNSLKTFQYFHFCKTHHHGNQPLLETGNALRSWILDEKTTLPPLGTKDLLTWYRTIK